MNILEETDLRYIIAPSTLPNAGFGLFAKEFLARGDYLEIIGVLVRLDGVADKCTRYAMRYKFAGSKLNAKIVPMGYGAIVNHCDDPAKRNCEIVVIKGLTKRNPNSSEVVYQFTRDIMPGEELLGDYGENLSHEIKKFNEGVEAVQDVELSRFRSYNLYPKVFSAIGFPP